MRLAPYPVAPGLMSDVGYQTSDFERNADTTNGQSNLEWPIAPAPFYTTSEITRRNSAAASSTL